jgi:hypothetical protein
MQVASMTSVPPPENATGLKFWNGHNTPKTYGSGHGSKFRGQIENVYGNPGGYTLPEAVELMHSDGYVIFRNVLNQEEVAALRAKIDGMGGADEQYNMKDWCFNKHVCIDYTQDAHLVEYIDKGIIADVCDTVMGGCVVGGGSLWVTGKGREMGIHVDALPVPLPEDILKDTRVRVPVFGGTAHYYLNDMVLELGPTLLIPGSHRAGRPPADESTWNGLAPCAAMVKAGSVVLFRNEIWHGAAMNSSTEKRYIMQVHYRSMSITRPYGPVGAECDYSEQVLKVATPRQKRLLGICEEPVGVTN